MFKYHCIVTTYMALRILYIEGRQPTRETLEPAIAKLLEHFTPEFAAIEESDSHDARNGTLFVRKRKYKTISDTVDDIVVAPVPGLELSMNRRQNQSEDVLTLISTKPDCVSLSIGSDNYAVYNRFTEELYK